MQHRNHHHHPHHPAGGAQAAGDTARGRGFRRRPFDYGALRLVVLSMIAERPAHGYELMKAIEERMGGGYSPSPGVIYPTLAWLEDMGFAAVEAEGGRKSYRITAEGESFLAANREPLAAILGGVGAGDRRRRAPEPVLDAMHDLKRALRSRFLRGEVEADEIARIAAALQAVAREIEAASMTHSAEPLQSRATVATPKAAGTRRNSSSTSPTRCRRASRSARARSTSRSGPPVSPSTARR